MFWRISQPVHKQWIGTHFLLFPGFMQSLSIRQCSKAFCSHSPQSLQCVRPSASMFIWGILWVFPLEIASSDWSCWIACAQPGECIWILQSWFHMAFLISTISKERTFKKFYPEIEHVMLCIEWGPICCSVSSASSWIIIAVPGKALPSPSFFRHYVAEICICAKGGIQFVLWKNTVAIRMTYKLPSNTVF